MNIRVITLDAARRKLARARSKSEEGVGIYGHACLGHRVHNLEAGNSHRKWKAVTDARRLVEVMEQHNLQKVCAVTLRLPVACFDHGFTTVYYIGDKMLLATFSSDKTSLNSREKNLLAQMGMIIQ